MFAPTAAVRTLVGEFRSKLLLRTLENIQDEGGVGARPMMIVIDEHVGGGRSVLLENRPGAPASCIADVDDMYGACGRSNVTATWFAFLRGGN